MGGFVDGLKGDCYDKCGSVIANLAKRKCGPARARACVCVCVCACVCVCVCACVCQFNVRTHCKAPTTCR